jgi:hypothetical protein
MMTYDVDCFFHMLTCHLGIFFGGDIVKIVDPLLIGLLVFLMLSLKHFLFILSIILYLICSSL